MRAVWSYWSKPIRTGARIPWRDQRSHYLCWALSVETARKHYPECHLVTDSDGARLLVDDLGLPFTRVSTELDALEGADCGWWALGKLHAYRAQDVRFVHIDTDVFLWKRLPAILEFAPVLAQNPEFIDDYPLYEPKRLHDLLRRTGGYVPEEWSAYLGNGPRIAACCGIMGGNDLELLHHYAEVAIRVVLDPRNRAAWAKEGDVGRHNPLIEQYLLCACVEHHNSGLPLRRRARIRYLFPSGCTDRAAEAGFTHLVSEAKFNRQVLERVGEVVKRDYPDLYNRCVARAERRTGGEAELHGESPRVSG
jgi:hypothetical protein